MLGPMITLTLLAIISGHLLQNIFTGPIGILTWGTSLNIPLHASLYDHEYIPLLIKLTPTIFGIMGLITSYLFFNSSQFYISTLLNYSFINLTTQKFYIDNIYNIFIAKSTVIFGYIQYIIFDRGYLEKMGPYGLIEMIEFLSKKIKIQSGFIIHYLLTMIASIILILLLATSGLPLNWPIITLILIILIII